MFQLFRMLYSLCFLLALPLVFTRLWLRGYRAPEYRRRWLERLGVFALPNRFADPKNLKVNSIWVHAVSLGETIAAVPVIKGLQQQYPDALITVTTTTPTGSAQVKKVFADSVFHVYAPYDVPWLVAAFLAKVKPKICIVLETELWPNLFQQCYQCQIPIAIINARLSPKSVRRYGWIKSYLQADVFNKIAWIAAQSAADQEKFIALGMDPAKVTASGNIKFDLQVVPEQQQLGVQLRASWGDRLVWIAASTHAGEETIVLAAFNNILAKFANALLVLVPRHPERFNLVAEMIANAGFTFARRSKQETCTANTAVFLLDTVGELGIFYHTADVAFVGGSLVPIGGHNVLEAAVAGMPVITGKYLHNFVEISSKMLVANVLQVVDNAAGLTDTVNHWFAHPVQAEAAGARGKALVAANRGATKHILTGIDTIINNTRQFYEPAN